jgi:ribonuclease HI
LIKGQALADFLAELCNLPDVEELPQEDAWITCVDGSSTRKRSNVGVVLTGPKDLNIESAIQLRFATNYEVEYEAVIESLSMAQEVGAKKLEIWSDLQVVVGNIKGEYEAKGDKMKKYLAKVKGMIEDFDKVLLTRVPWEDNA